MTIGERKDSLEDKFNNMQTKKFSISTISEREMDSREINSSEDQILISDWQTN